MCLYVISTQKYLSGCQMEMQIRRELTYTVYSSSKTGESFVCFFKMKQLLIFLFMISVRRLIKKGRIFAWSDRIYTKSKLVKMINCIFHLNSVKLFCRYCRFDLWDCLHGFFVFCFSTFFLFGKICERKLLGKRIPNQMEKISKSLPHGSD